MRQQAGSVFINENRQLAFDILIAAYNLETPRDYLEHVTLKNWQVVVLETEPGDPVGALAIKDHEAHIGILAQFRGKWKPRSTIQALCELFHIHYTFVGRTKPLHVLFFTRHGWRCLGMTERGYFLVRKELWD